MAFGMISSGSMKSINKSGVYYIGNSVTDKPSTYGGLLIFVVANSSTMCGIYVTNTSSPGLFAVSVVNSTWTYTQL